MKLVFQQEIIEFDNKVTAEVIIEKINDILESGYYFSHFIADEIEVYENHESYLNAHIHAINQLEIIAKTMKEFTNDVLLSAEDYVKRALPELRSISNEFYNNPTDETWERFEQLLEGLQWINGVIKTIGQSNEKPDNWGEYEEIATALQEELANLEEAVENEDHVLIGDMIQYEILPNFEALQGAVQTTIDNEGTRPNLN
ncbi:hypothetical protein HNO89_000848 [Sporosarcina luteola]|nr:hypothetical protein [Sporosarcina luteola]